jgi:hypothetical protein
MELKYKFIKERITYTGAELSSHWLYRNFGLKGNALAAFIGPCEVKEYLVDMEDRRKDREIRSPLMLHFISEYFDLDLEKTILRQRLFISILGEEINRISKKHLERIGNDLYVKDSKLSVAIATLTPVSCVFHVGINIATSGAPVKVIGLDELSVSPMNLANRVFKHYSQELKDISMARAKVRGVL